MSEDRLESIKNCVVSGKRADALAAVEAALSEGVDAKRLMTQALIPAMNVVGEKYSTGEFFLPQMMIAARAMSEAMQRLGPQLVSAGYERKAKAVIGTVVGDFHDIGKNIVKMMMEGNGFEVVDLGVDVAPEAFIDAVRRESPRFVLMSALITLTMESMRRTLEALEQSGVRRGVIVGVGGAPLTHKFAEEIGADFYAADAYGCVERCNQLLASAGVHR
ncbi:MAG TPA: corrinoid protein [Burkholderiales bacterium]|nr:corrinoid protein [Burkholderiales bacterium]